ncbi:triacylglycerol lipase [Fowl aviadenovirus D]|nr:triacylglycerol lipase [Fowl aviadenovirus D]
MKKEFNVTFFAEDVYDLEFFLQFEVIKLKVTVSSPVNRVVEKVTTAEPIANYTSVNATSVWESSDPTPTSEYGWNETATNADAIMITLNASEPFPRMEALQAPVQIPSEEGSTGVSTEALFLIVVGLAFVAMMVTLLRTRSRKPKGTPPLLISEESFTL